MNSTQKDRHIIWSDMSLDLDDWRDDLKENYPDYSDDELYRVMYGTNADYLADERMNLDNSAFTADYRHCGFGIVERT